MGKSQGLLLLKRINIIWFVVALGLAISSSAIVDFYAEQVLKISPSKEKAFEEYIEKINNLQMDTEQLKKVWVVQERRNYKSLRLGEDLVISEAKFALSVVSGIFLLLFLWGILIFWFIDKAQKEQRKCSLNNGGV